MPCSNCHQSGHNYIRCPIMSEIEKQEKKAANIARNALRNARREQRRQLFQNATSAETVSPTLSSIRIHNTNQYELSAYSCIIGDTQLTHFSYIGAHSGRFIKIDRSKHRVVLFPTLDICTAGNIAVKKIPLEKLDDYFVVMDFLGTDHDAQVTDIVVDKKDYAPKKSELEQWKEVSLKSHYLLTQLIKLGGKNIENLAPMLDMVEDIKIPKHSEYDKELAGIPSAFTNVT